MNGRRRFLMLTPMGAFGLAACSGQPAAPAAATVPAAAPVPATATPPAAAAAVAARPAPLLAAIPPDAVTLEYTPKHEELVYTFGGAAPKHRIRSGTRIVTWTEDCFDGAVKTAADLPSQVVTPGHDNPQTGPFFIEGAEPGDTVPST